MARIESTVTIARRPEDVFGYFLNLDETVPRTNPGVEWMVRTPDGPTQVGTILRSRGRSLGRTRETTMRFTTIVPHERIEFEAEVGPMRPTCAFTFDQTDGGTRVTLLGDPNPVGAFKVLSPLFVRIGRRVWGERLARAKATLERPPS